MKGDTLEILQEFFDVAEEKAEAILLLTQWVDQDIAVERFGYPKDNLIPPPMEERLGDDDYLKRLCEVAGDQEPELAEIIAQKRREIRLLEGRAKWRR